MTVEYSSGIFKTSSRALTWSGPLASFSNRSISAGDCENATTGKMQQCKRSSNGASLVDSRNQASERIHVSPGFGVGALRIKSGDSNRDLVCACNAERHKFPPPNPRKKTLKILALDLGKFNTMCCFFDSKSRKHSFLNASTDRNFLATSSKNTRLISSAWKPADLPVGSTI